MNQHPGERGEGDLGDARPAPEPEAALPDVAERDGASRDAAAGAADDAAAVGDDFGDSDDAAGSDAPDDVAPAEEDLAAGDDEDLGAAAGNITAGADQGLAAADDGRAAAPVDDDSAAVPVADDSAAALPGECADLFGYPGEAADEQALAASAAALRGMCVRKSAGLAAELREVARLVRLTEAAARRRLAASPRVSTQPDDLQLIDSAVTGEVMAVYGISTVPADRLIFLARRLTGVHQETLTALEQGRLDETRARVLAEATVVCTDAVAREVEAMVLPAAGATPWQAPSPRAWRARVERAVITADPRAARARREQAVAERALRTWPDRDGTGVLWMRTGIEDIALAERVVSGLAQAWPTEDEHGRRLSMDQRRVDAVMDLLRRVRDGDLLPGLTVRREREIGLVLHTDTFFGDGPAAGDPGERRGLGTPAPVDPATARESAQAQIAAGASTCVFLTDTRGVLQRLVRLLLAPGQPGWTRASLTAAVRAALPDLPRLCTGRYAPTVAITEHVHARSPRCAAYDCARIARHADLDHDQPWPRGPTDVSNLCPRCRRHHELKTRGLVTTRLQPDGTVHTRMLTGITVTTRPEPLPGHAPGEGYGLAKAS